MCSKGVLKQPWKVTHIIFSRIIQKDHSVQHTGRKFRCWSSLQCDRKTTFVLMNSWHGVGLLLKQKRKGPTQHEALDLDNRENKKCCRKHRDLNMTSYNIWPLTSYYWKYFWIFAPFEHFSTKTPQGWAYRTNSQHFATTSDGWMEATDSKTRWFTLRWSGITTTLLISSTICLTEKKT